MHGVFPRPLERGTDKEQTDGEGKSVRLRGRRPQRAADWYSTEELAAALHISVEEFLVRWARWKELGWVAEDPPEYPGGPVRRRLAIPGQRQVEEA